MTAKKPNGFFIHADRFSSISSMLSFAEIGRLITAACAYFETGETPSSRSRKFLACFELLREDIDRDVARYREICEKNRERINRRWHNESGNTPGSSGNTPEYRGIPAYTYTTQSNTTQYNTTQYNTTQSNAAQSNAAQSNAAQPRAAKAPVPSGTKAQQAAASPSGTQTKGDVNAHADPRFTGCTLL